MEENINDNNCRLCLNKFEKFIEIFDEQGIRLDIANILSKHFWFEVSFCIIIN